MLLLIIPYVSGLETQSVTENRNDALKIIKNISSEMHMFEDLAG